MADQEPDDPVDPATSLAEEEEKVLPTYSWEEIVKHKNAQSLWMVIHNKVYDVTKFMEEHPGGEEVLLEQAGRDGTEAFEDVGHSPDAREIQETYLIGQLDPTSRRPAVPIKTSPNAPEVESSNNNWILAVGVLGVAIAVAAVIYRVYFSV